MPQSQDAWTAKESANVGKIRFSIGRKLAESTSHGKKSTGALNEKEIRELMAVMRLVGQEDLSPLYSIPPKVRFGAHFFYSKACFGCHRIDGQGGKMGEVKAPDLTFRPLRPKKWHIEHIHDATSVVPNSKMPPFFH